MREIKYWIHDFLGKHWTRYRRIDWPDASSPAAQDLARVWMRAFIEHRVTEEEANLASERLGMNPPKYRDDHIPAILHEVEAIRKANGQAAAPDSREEAERLSRDCPKCQGMGQLRVYHPRYTGNAVITIEYEDGTIARGPAHVSAHCTCPLGRWMRGKTEPEMKRRILDLADVEAGLSRWLAHDPTLAVDVELEPSR